MPLGVAPATANVLLGDTVRFASWSDDGSALATWTVQGEALAFLSGATVVPDLVTPTDQVLVKALSLGQSTIVAKSGIHEARAQLNVADSSVIATLIARVCCSPDPEQILVPIKVGTQLPLSSVLRDAMGNFYTTRPVWSSSDSLTVDFEHSYERFDSAFGPVTNARLRKAGTVKLIASFMALRDTLELTVVP